MTESEFNALVARISNALACGRDLATDYARAIGDSPEISLGKILVRDENGRIVAHLPESVLG
jgi:hypothetical protein